MITRRTVLALSTLPPLAATACTPSEIEMPVSTITGQAPDWIAEVDGYQGMEVRLEVSEAADVVTIRAFAAPDPNQGKGNRADIGFTAQVPFTLSEPLGARKFLRADGSTIEQRS